jgi:uncharacterized protein (DUF2236 family)
MSVADQVPVEAGRSEAEQFVTLGPDSIFWRISADWRGVLLAGRVLIMQVAHPVVGAGVGEHSVYKTDPYGRLDRTTRSTMRFIYGEEEAHAEGARLRQMHRDIKGVDDQGRRYSALNPEAYLWVHATAFELGIVFHELFATPLTADEQAQFFQEWRTVGWRLGIPIHHIPKTQAEFWDFWYGVLPKLENNYVVQDLLWGATQAPPKVPEFIFRPLNDTLANSTRRLTAYSLPEEIRERIELPKLTPAEERKVRRLLARMRFLGDHLPPPLLSTPMAAKARKAATARYNAKAS